MEPLLDPQHRELEEQLLAAGRQVRCSEAARQSTLAALGLGTAGLTGSGQAAAGQAAGHGAAAKGAAGLGWHLGKPLVLVAAGVGGALGVGGVVAVTLAPRAPAPATVSAPRVSPSALGAEGVVPAVAASAAPPDSAAAPKPPSFALEDLPEADAPSGGAAPRAPLPPAAQSSALRQELEQLARVEAALRDGAAARALTLLEDYRLRFPRRQLGLEAEALAIQALAVSGALAPAQARARAFLARHPTSPLAARVARYAD
jgi:hypothetical protein